MQSNTHYPENLLKDYQTLMQFFPSNSICRPELPKLIEAWCKESGNMAPRILEVGPGFGETTTLLLDTLPCTLVLVDVDQKAADTLRQTFSSDGDRVSVVAADALAWIQNEPSDSYDIFTASWTVHNFSEDERRAFLPEVYRVLKKGGLFAIFDKVIPDDPVVADAYLTKQAVRLQGLDALGKTVLKEEMLAHEARDALPPYRWMEADVLRDLTEAGFYDVTFRSRNERDVIVLAQTAKEKSPTHVHR